jgi:Zn ribbon nucleic-acid-binding protein
MEKKYCEYCSIVLHEDTLNGTLRFICVNCDYARSAHDTETLLFTKKNDNTLLTDYANPYDIATNITSQRIPIDCECGSKVGVVKLFDENLIPIKVCVHCYKQLN